MPAAEPSIERAVRRRIPGAARRERILEAARELFAERDYDAVNIADIARRAGVSRTVLYDHFPSKSAVLLSFLEDEVAGLFLRAGEAIGGAGDDRARLRATLDAIFGYIEERPLAFRLLSLTSSTDQDIAAAGARMRATTLTAVGTLLAGDAGRGRTVSQVQVNVGVASLTSAIQGVTAWWLEHPDVPRAEVVDALADFLWNGLGVTSTS